MTAKQNHSLVTRRAALGMLGAAVPVLLASGIAAGHESDGARYGGHRHGHGHHHGHNDDHHHGKGHHHGYADDDHHHGHAHRHADDDHGPHHHGMDWQEKKSEKKS